MTGDEVNLLIDAVREQFDREIGHINGDLEEIKQEQRDQRKLTSDTREDVVGLKTELRIIGGIILTLLLALMGILLNHLVAVGAIP